MEISGYGCEDHFFELDTVRHSWEMLADILKDPELTSDLLCDIGMPVEYKGSLYNCRVFCLNQEIIVIRRKRHLAGGNNYREERWFKPWTLDGGYGTVQSQLPDVIKQMQGQQVATFGNAVVQCNDTEIASEICEDVCI